MAGGDGPRTIGDSASVRAWRLRRNVVLPVVGVLLALGGFLFTRQDGPDGALGWLGVWIGGLLAPLVVARNAFRTATPVVLGATRDALTVDDRVIPVSDIVEVKLVQRPSRRGDHVLELVLRDRSTLALSTTLGGATVVLDMLRIVPGERRTTFTTVVLYRWRLLVAMVTIGFPWIVLNVLGGEPLYAVPFSLVFGIAPTCAFLAFLAGVLRGKVVIGADGLTRRWLFWRRFVPYADIASIAPVRPLTNRFGVDARVRLRGGSRLRLRAYEAPDTAEQRGAESRALLDHLEKAYARAAEQRGAGAEVALLRRGSRSAEEWLASLKQVGGSAGAGYRVATVTPEVLVDVVRAVDGPLDARVGAAAALIGTGDEAHRTAVRVAAEACADPATREILYELLAIDSEEGAVAILDRVER